MDHAAFLRSLNCLRPLAPEVWDGSIVNNDEEPDSGSTNVSPPTPSNNSIMVFEDSLFAVSIEPNSIVEQDDQQASSRKRGRGKKDFGIGPAFFPKKSVGRAKKGNANATAGAMDVDPENDGVTEDNGNAGEAELKRKINADPSLCTFEAAIVKKLPSELGGELVHDESAFDTPNKHRNHKRQAKGDETDETESKALVFRFGDRFVFQVDESKILDLKYEKGETNSNQIGDASPSSKRQRNGKDSTPHTGTTSANTKNRPPCLMIAFASCTFRIFSLVEEKSDTNEGSATDRIWGTLAKTVESLESRFVKALSLLTQYIEIEKKENLSSWKMAPPGSGLAFHAWPESFERLSFHSNPLKYKAPDFLEEEWSHSLRKNHTIPSTVASPQKSSIASSRTGSSTRVEQGQNERTPTKNRPSPSHVTKNHDADKCEHDENDSSPNHSSELTHESGMQDDGARLKPHDDGAQTKNSESSLFKEPGEDRNNSEEINNKQDVEKSKESHTKNASQLDDDNNKTEKDEKPAEELNKGHPDLNGFVLLPLWKDDLYKKYHLFDTSAQHMERAMDPVALLPQHQPNGTSISHLTSCAQSLSSSYLIANDFMKFSQLCENDIDNVTSEIDKVLEKMFPPRRKKVSAEAMDESKDFQSRVEELMTLRKEAVAAKFALLMTPKR